MRPKHTSGAMPKSYLPNSLSLINQNLLIHFQNQKGHNWDPWCTSLDIFLGKNRYGKEVRRRRVAAIRNPNHQAPTHLGSSFSKPTGAGHINRISLNSWFISLIPFKKWNLYNVYIHSTQTDIFQVFISFNFDDYNWQLMKTPNSVSQKSRILWKYWRHLVPHSNQLINSKHLQRPLNGLSV